METLINSLLPSRQAILNYYFPLNFIREIDPGIQYKHLLGSAATTINIFGKPHLFFGSELEWDSRFFGLKTYKLNAVLFDHNNPEIINNAVAGFTSQILSEYQYMFMEVPSEDILLLQALGTCKWKLIETRLTYYRGNLDQFNSPRYTVRKADEHDTANLMRVAMEMRNRYDRFHADTTFSVQKADEFLAAYIKESLKGFADVVLVPDEKDIPSDSFLTAKYLKNEWKNHGVPVSKMVLSAVSSSNKGWYKKLISEMTWHLKDVGADYIFMNTQSTNRAVIHTWESLGYKFGCATHIMSISKT